MGGALDGGAQVMIFLLSFAVFGASGADRRFPSVSAIPCMLLVFGLSLMAARRTSGPEILQKETSITVTEMVLWIEYVPLDGTTPREL